MLNTIEWLRTVIACNHPRSWTDAVIDEVVARLQLAATSMTKIEERLHRVAEVIEATYAHDAEGRRIEDAEPEMSGADCFAAMCELEPAVFEAARLVASEGEQPEQRQAASADDRTSDECSSC